MAARLGDTSQLERFAGGLVLATALLFQALIGLTQTTVVDLAGDPQVAKTLFLPVRSEPTAAVVRAGSDLA